MNWLYRLTGLLVCTFSLICFAIADDKCGDEQAGRNAEYSAGNDSGASAQGEGHKTQSQRNALADEHQSRITSSEAQGDLRQVMLKLWEEHIVYTRNVILCVAAGGLGEDVVDARLMQNQTDIGNAFKPYYGVEAGNKLASLLRDHIKHAGEEVKALKAKDASKAASEMKELYSNADQIAAFLSQANPQNWPEARMDDMLRDHNDLLAKEAKSEMSGDWKASIAAYDDGHELIIRMSNALTDGIARQFPESSSCMSLVRASLVRSKGSQDPPSTAIGGLVTPSSRR